MTDYLGKARSNSLKVLRKRFVDPDYSTQFVYIFVHKLYHYKKVW